MANVEVKTANDSFLIVAIHRWATQSQILGELRGILRDHRIPVRQVDPRIFEALRLRKEQALSYPDASRAIFGSDDWAEKLRGWNNKLEAAR
jgi:hypothetical protein